METNDAFQKEDLLWLFNENIYIRLFLVITRPGLGSLFQNLGFLMNIERWNTILSGPSKANIDKS